MGRMEGQWLTLGVDGRRGRLRLIWEDIYTYMDNGKNHSVYNAVDSISH